MLELWIARDKDGSLYLFYNEPQRIEDWGEFGFYGGGNIHLSEDSNLFPEVTWENSPQKVKIELV